MKAYQLILTEPHLQTVLAALDFYSRVGCGQFDEILRLFRADPRQCDGFQSDAAKQLLTVVKQSLFPLSGNAAYSIAGPEVPVEYRRAYDVYQVCQHHLAVENPVHSMDVALDDPHNTSGEPFCQITTVVVA